MWVDNGDLDGFWAVIGGGQRIYGWILGDECGWTKGTRMDLGGEFGWTEGYRPGLGDDCGNQRNLVILGTGCQVWVK
jgi:hypothetical protein